MRFFALLLISILPLAAQTPPGEAVYKQRCAGCHEQNNQRIPTREALAKMSATRILRTLNYGAMIAVAYTMPIADREAVSKYLGGTAADTPLPATAFCADRAVKLPNSPKLTWNGWSPANTNTRFQPTAMAGLSIEQTKSLKLKWAFAFDGDLTAFSQPTIVDDNLFTGSAGGAIYALNRLTGCIKWVYQATGPVRTALRAERDGNRWVLMFGDQTGWFYTIDASNGKELWKKHLELHDAGRLTGAATAYQGTVYVPVASWEENRASDPKYPCCTMRGNLVAMRIRDGKELWRTYFVDPPKQTGVTKDGVAKFGPSGAPVWTAPTLDLARGLIYVTTGDNYSKPANELSDAVVALEMRTGRIVWSKQFTQEDTFSGACLGTSECGPDFDFGASAMLVRAGDRDLIVAGQKSGIVWALDPDKKGELVWQLRVGRGSTNGGVQWGTAADGQNAYAAVSDIVRVRRRPTDLADLRTTDLDPQAGGGITAIRLTDGTQVWHQSGQACEPPKPGCSPAQPSAVTAIPGVIFSGSINGHVRAYSAEDGKVLWDFDTAREFTTVNGVKGNGGSIDGPGAVVAQGMVYINSGYSRQAGMPGNVLLAFEPEK